jgi:hypothetical protein
VTDTAEELHSTALLYDVRGLVRRGRQRRRPAERDVIAGRERIGSHVIGGGSSVSTDVSANLPYIMLPERPLDLLEVRQLRAPSARAGARSLVLQRLVARWISHLHSISTACRQ